MLYGYDVLFASSHRPHSHIILAVASTEAEMVLIAFVWITCRAFCGISDHVPFNISAQFCP
uniref:Uncharacterized protein n=1 Tax=Arundo donax TaxID=35708 RepID=A0A0A8YHS8_ARUDO